MKIKIEMTNNEIHKIVNASDELNRRLTGKDQHTSVPLKEQYASSRLFNGSHLIDADGNSITEVYLSEEFTDVVINMFGVFADSIESAIKTIKRAFKSFGIAIGDAKETDINGKEIPGRLKMERGQTIRTTNGDMEVLMTKHVVCHKDEIELQNKIMDLEYKKHIVI